MTPEEEGRLFELGSRPEALTDDETLEYLKLSRKFIKEVQEDARK